MSLFSKPIGAIIYEDVEAFCNKTVRENYILDYKQEISSGDSLEKTVVAMANSLGGHVIIGVEEDKNKKGYPKLPPTGVSYENDLEDRVRQKIFDTIYPTLDPEIQVCAPKDNKTFIIVRVHPSPIAPHAISNRQGIYIRTADINKLDQRATLEQIEWLQERRKKSQDLKEQLKSRAKERAHFIVYKGSSNNNTEPYGNIFFSLIPQFPFQSHLSPRDIANSLHGWGIDRHGYPDFHSRDPIVESIKGGAFLGKVYERYLEVNEFGLIFFARSLGTQSTPVKEGGPPKRVFRVGHFVRYLDLFLEYSHRVYEQMEVVGPLELFISVENVGIGHNVYILETPNVSDFESFDLHTQSINAEVNWERTIMVSDLQPISRNELVKTMGENIAWSLGYKYSTSDSVNFWLKP